MSERAVEQLERPIEYGVPYREGGINFQELEVGNCLEIIGESGKLYIFQVVEKIKIDAGLQGSNISIRCIHGKGKLENSTGGIVNENRRIEVGERLYIGDAYTHSSKLVELTVWRNHGEINIQRHIDFDEWVDMFYSKALSVGQYISANGRDGAFYLFRVGEVNEETGKPKLHLVRMEYQNQKECDGQQGELYGDVIGKGMVLRVGKINTGLLDSVKVSRDYPVGDFEEKRGDEFRRSKELESTATARHQEEVVGQPNPWLAREAVFSQVGVIVTGSSEILADIFTETERRVLRVLGFSDRPESINITALKAKAETYLTELDQSIPHVEDPDRAELELLREAVPERVNSMLKKLKEI